MFGVYTRRSIAMVQNIHPFWNRADVKFPSNPMCEDRFSITDLSIPLLIYRSRPKPAPSVGFWHPIFLESNLKGRCSVDTQIKGFSTDCSKSSIEQGRKTFFRFGRKILAKDFFFRLSPQGRFGDHTCKYAFA